MDHDRAAALRIARLGGQRRRDADPVDDLVGDEILGRRTCGAP
jgi:hypothetical protein